MNGISLGVARSVYLVCVGVAFFAAASLSSSREMGVFALASAYGSIATAIVNLGVDRIALLRAAERPSRQVSHAVIRARRPSIILCTVGTAILGFWNPGMLGAAAITVTRVAVNDAEAVAIGRAETRPVTIATLANAALTSVATIAAARSGHVALLWASASGNVVALVILLAALRKAAARQPSVEVSRPIPWSQVWPYGLMAVAGVIYLRGGFAIMPVRGITAKDAASYALAFKAFELIIAMRGAIVQRASASIATAGRTTEELLVSLSRSAALGATAMGIAGIAAAVVGRQVGLLSSYPHVWSIVVVVGSFAPLIMSHTLTSAIIFSHTGQVQTLFESIGLSIFALLVIAVAAPDGPTPVMAVTCGMEFVSFLYFWMRFKRAGSPLSSLTIMWPVGAFVPLALIGGLVR